MDKTEIKNLLARALAYMEDESSLSELEADELMEDLQVQIENLEE